MLLAFVLFKRLAVKRVSKMIYIVSNETYNLNSVNDSINTMLVLQQ